MRQLLAAVGAAALASTAAGAPAAPPAALADQLGAPEFARREAAAAELARLGPAALPALDATVRRSASAEARDRASRLAERIRRDQDAERWLKWEPVALSYAGLTVADAVTDFKTRTGIPVTLDVGGVQDPLRRIHVRTGSLPPWEALAELCRAAGLRERHRAEALPASTTLADQLHQRRRAYSLSIDPTATPGTLPILLADGEPEALPISLGGAVRVAAMPPGFPGSRAIRGAGEVQLMLEVTPLPHTGWRETVGVRVRRAIDADGRSLSAWYRPEPAATDSSEFQGWAGGAPLGAVQFLDGDGAAVMARPNPRLASVRLRTDDRLTPRLRLLEGTVTGELIVPDQVLMQIGDLAHRTGVSAVGPDDTRLTILAYEPTATGTTVRVRAEAPASWAIQRPGVRLRQPAPRSASTGAGTVAGVLRFFDAQGRPLRYGLGTPASPNGDPFRQVQELELHFTRSADAGAPERVEAVGSKPVTVDVPFRLENVPLP